MTNERIGGVTVNFSDSLFIYLLKCIRFMNKNENKENIMNIEFFTYFSIGCIGK